MVSKYKDKKDEVVQVTATEVCDRDEIETSKEFSFIAKTSKASTKPIKKLWILLDRKTTNQFFSNQDMLHQIEWNKTGVRIHGHSSSSKIH